MTLSTLQVVPSNIMSSEMAMPEPCKIVPQEVVLDYVRREAAKKDFIERIFLFGSRAKGNARPYSDYDLAVELAPNTPAIPWLAFAKNLDEEAPTLCKLSLMQLRDSVRKELRDSIAKEGILIYERRPAR